MSCDCLAIVLRLSCDCLVIVLWGGGKRARPVVAGAGALPVDCLLPQSCCQDPTWHVLATAACATRFRGTVPPSQECLLPGWYGVARLARLPVHRSCLSGLASNRAEKEMGITDDRPQLQPSSLGTPLRCKTTRFAQYGGGWRAAPCRSGHPAALQNHAFRAVWRWVAGGTTSFPRVHPPPPGGIGLQESTAKGADPHRQKVIRSTAKKPHPPPKGWIHRQTGFSRRF